MSSKLKPHPYADTYPVMSAAELAALAEDIGAHGQRQPIILYQGMVLDGRNRLLACQAAGKEPRTEAFEGDDSAAMALVRSLNDHRREMTAGKWALVAARQWMLGDTHDRTPSVVRNHSSSNGVKTLAKHFRCSDKSIRQARDLLENAADLVEKVDAGTPLAEAHREWEEREKAKEQHNRDMACLGEYRERVEAGRMKFEEAMRRVEEERRKEEEKRRNWEDSRRRWLADFEEALQFLEDRVAACPDTQLAWFTQEGQPGTDGHEISPERIEKAVDGLKRAQKISFGEKNGSQQGSRRGRKTGGGADRTAPGRTGD